MRGVASRLKKGEAWKKNRGGRFEPDCIFQIVATWAKILKHFH
jgi:hypothetical protein